MRIDGHMHLTEPVNMILITLGKMDFHKAVICSAGLAGGEQMKSLSDAKAIMGRIKEAQNKAVMNKPLSQVNRELAKIVGQYPDKLVGFGKVDLFCSNMVENMEEIVTLGLKGIGEIIGIHEHTELLEPLFQFSHQQKGFPFFIHCDYPVDSIDLEHLFKLVKQYDKAKVIIGHLGGDYWVETVEQSLRAPNVFLDTSEVVNMVALKVAIKELPEQVIFGSDFPWESPEAMLKRVECIGLSPDLQSQVLGHNMQALLK